MVIYLAQIIENRVDLMDHPPLYDTYRTLAPLAPLRECEADVVGSVREIYLAHSKYYSSSLSNCLVIISKMTETKIKTTESAIATPRLRSKPI